MNNTRTKQENFDTFKIYQIKSFNRFKTLNSIGCVVKSFKTKDDTFGIFNVKLKRKKHNVKLHNK